MAASSRAELGVLANARPLVRRRRLLAEERVRMRPERGDPGERGPLGRVEALGERSRPPRRRLYT
jgi:hypothetical protein